MTSAELVRKFHDNCETKAAVSETADNAIIRESAGVLENCKLLEIMDFWRFGIKTKRWADIPNGPSDPSDPSDRRRDLLTQKLLGRRAPLENWMPCTGRAKASSIPSFSKILHARQADMCDEADKFLRHTNK